ALVHAEAHDRLARRETVAARLVAVVARGAAEDAPPVLEALHGIPGLRVARGAAVPEGGFAQLARGLVVQRELRGAGLGRGAVAAQQRARDAAVQLGAPLLQQRAVGGLAQQRVAEAVDRLGGRRLGWRIEEVGRVERLEDL